MRINEKMGLVYTALFLTVSIAVITQNSDELMAKFRGENGVVAVDDIYTVVAGRDHDLTVLRNDLRIHKISLADVHLLGQPLCGTVKPNGATFRYSSDKTCTGHQAFSYCIDTRSKCQAATVALRIVEARDPVNSIVEGPILDVSGLEVQQDINSQDLEISNIRLGKIAPVEETAVLAASVHLQDISVDPTRLMPPNLEKAGFARSQRKPETENLPADRHVAQLGTTMTDATTPRLAADVTLPRGPKLGILGFGVLDGHAASLARVARREAAVTAPTLPTEAALGPFGTGCDTRMRVTPRKGGIADLSLVATCLPNSRIEIRHGPVVFTLQTDPTGHAAAAIPALEAEARFVVHFPDGRTLTETVRIPDMLNIHRVAVHWAGPAEIDLHAFEFGAGENEKGHVWEGQPGQATTGSIAMLGDATETRAHRAEIYTLPKTAAGRGVVDFVLAAHPDPATCGQSQVVRMVQSQNGHVVLASGLKMKLPACGAAPTSIVLKNAIRGMIIARN